MGGFFGRARAGVDFDRDAVQVRHPGDEILVELRRPRGRVLDGDMGGHAPGAHVPDIEVPDPDFAAVLDAAHDVLVQARVGAVVEEDPGGLAQQAQGPAADDQGADDAHGRVQPGQAPESAAQQGEDGQDRGQGVGQDVHVGGLQVVVVGVGMVLVAQPPGAQEVDCQADDGHQSGGAKGDGDGGYHTHGRLCTHEGGHEEQTHGRGEPGQGVDLAGPEDQVRVVGVAAGPDVGEPGHGHGPGMAGHVPAVGQQGHGAEKPARDDLGGHGPYGQPEDEARAAFAVFVVVMVVSAGTGMVVHGFPLLFDRQNFR